ncbi:MAG TPA: glutamine synthetase family protein [Acidimicrobiales bacterium]|nr:glutamine synthetase family protein [Acidimicrobiales bacterium]
MTTADSGDGGELLRLIDAGDIDTVVLAITDMQGRLQGKRLDARFFRDEVVSHAAEGCNYLLAVDVDMRTVDGYAMSSWERGYGDFVMRPDMTTWRPLPWHPGSAIVLADVEWEDGSPVVPSPRQVLRRQVERCNERGWTALAGTELEFMVFNDSYEQAWSKAYRGLDPVNQYNVDYSIMGTSRIEPLLHRIRTSMSGAGMKVESAKGECNLGQHEIAFMYTEALAKADEHAIFKTGAKEIAAQEGCSLTFIAKYDEREGNSCHVHFSLREDDGTPLFAGGGPHGMSDTFQHFLAGQLAALRELTLFLAPNVNSYKRYVPGSFAPTAVAWGRDNRTCAYRIVGHGPSLRLECRVPGGDANPYLTIAALIAAGLHGVDNKLELEPELIGNAYVADKPHVPSTLRDAAALFEGSAVAREAFGDEVVAHYLNYARVELAAFDAAVTDWERFRGFERL